MRIISIIVSIQGIMMNGAINAVRSGAASASELADILNTAEASGLVLQNSSVLERLAPKLKEVRKKPKWVVLLWEEATQEQRKAAGVPLHTFDEVRCFPWGNPAMQDAGMMTGVHRLLCKVALLR